MQLLALFTLAAVAKGHTIFQQLSVNGAAQGSLVGVRAPSTNNPIYDVTSAAIACNSGLISPVSTKIVTVPAGAKVGTQWGHVIGGAQFANDADNPIASSHKGPISYYLAKVDNAGTASTTGLKWFKVASDGLNNGLWGVDNMIANGGYSYFTMPSCIAPGNYILRAELIALHSAYSAGGAQFYLSCANINVSGSGSFTPSSTVSFPGAYGTNDPAIVINIYGSSGKPDNGGKAYTAPGPAPIVCPAGGGSTSPKPTTSSKPTTSLKPTTSPKPTTLATSVKATAAPPAPTSGSGSGCAALYGQCGGQGWVGATTCAQGECEVVNPYYSQCM